MSNDCMFQYGTNKRMLVDTDLITKQKALELFSKNKNDFIERMKKDENPQMAIWINCNKENKYTETYINWDADDFIIFEGELYQKV